MSNSKKLEVCADCELIECDTSCQIYIDVKEDRDYNAWKDEPERDLTISKGGMIDGTEVISIPCKWDMRRWG